MKNASHPLLDKEFRRLKNEHREALRNTVARSVTGPSVMRVYKGGTKQALMPVLAEQIEIDALTEIRDQSAFSDWYDAQLNYVVRAITPLNDGNTRIFPGVRWGHATKILSLFVRDLVLRSDYFSHTNAKRISPFLHVPIDSIVMKRLRELGVAMPFSKIRDIDKRAKFYAVQEILIPAARKAGIPRVWFDDNWGDRQ